MYWDKILLKTKQQNISFNMELFLKRCRRHGMEFGIRWHCFCLCICLRLTVFWNEADAPLPSVSWDGAALFVFRVLLFDVRLWRRRRAPDYTFPLEVFFLKSCFMWNWNQLHHRWLTTIKDPEECEAFNHCDQIFDTGRRAESRTLVPPDISSP